MHWLWVIFSIDMFWKRISYLKLISTNYRLEIIFSANPNRFERNGIFGLSQTATIESNQENKNKIISYSNHSDTTAISRHDSKCVLSVYLKISPTLTFRFVQFKLEWLLYIQQKTFASAPYTSWFLLLFFHNFLCFCVCLSKFKYPNDDIDSISILFLEKKKIDLSFG